jgi:hypothetical protein
MMVFPLSVAFAVIFHVSVGSSDDDDAGSETHRVTGGDGARGRVAGAARLGEVASNPDNAAFSFRRYGMSAMKSSWLGSFKTSVYLKQARKYRLLACDVPCAEVEGQQQRCRQWLPQW